MLEKIQSQLEHLNKSECKVVRVILALPDNTIHSSIAALALEASASGPTMNHFCRSVDTHDFPDFKPCLAQSLADGTPYINRNANEDDSAESYAERILESIMAVLDYVRHSLDKFVINRAVDLLIQARKIALLGLGSSAVAAHDATNKFFCFNVPVVHSDDTVLQRMSCMNCSDRDVVVLISHMGRTKNLVELMQLARENDAMIIVLISAGTPFARGTTLVITLDVPEGTDIYMPMVSRPAQLTVIDVLATEFILWRGIEFRDDSKQVRETLKEPRFDKQLLSPGDDH